MNKARRKWLQGVISTLEQAKEDIESIREEEQECYDNMPEGIQLSSKGDAMQDNIDDLDNASGDLEDIIDNLIDIMERG